MEWMRGFKQPALESFLSEDELFIHLKQGKEVGYFNALLLKSKRELEEALKQHQKDFTIKVEQGK
jgi:hypothetical protein